MVLQILFLGPSNLLEPNASFSQMSQKLIVSPIVKTLVFSKVPEKVQVIQFIHDLFTMRYFWIMAAINFSGKIFEMSLCMPIRKNSVRSPKCLLGIEFKSNQMPAKR